MKTVLVVDDDRLLRQILVRALNKVSSDLLILEAGDGEEAIALMGKQKVHLVITDINMPRASGLIVLAYLNAFLPDVPCFVMTAYGTSRLKAKLPPDLLRFYQKPFDFQDMARSALAALDRQAGDEACQGVALIHLLGLANAEGVSCTVAVSGPAQQTGRLYIRQGDLIDAVCGGLIGEAAAIETLSWRNAAYCIAYDLPATIERRIQASLDDLLRPVADCLPPVPSRN